MARLAYTLLVAALCGCSASGGVLPNHGGNASSVATKPADGAQRHTAEDNIDIYLQTLHDLIEGDSVAQIDAFRRAADAASTAPTTTNRGALCALRHAVAEMRQYLLRDRLHVGAGHVVG